MISHPLEFNRAIFSRKGSDRLVLGAAIDGKRFSWWGQLAQIFFQLVGVSDDDICREYALSRVGMEPAREVVLSHMTESPPVCEAMLSSRCGLEMNTHRVLLRYL